MSVSALDESCQLGVIMIEQELKSFDPDVKEERCGLLADRHEIFAMNIPEHSRFRSKCHDHRLAVSIDLKTGPSPTATLHGIVPAQSACDASKRLATKHLGLVNPSWE